MFVNNTGASTRGGLAVAIPGEMACLASAHDQYGRLPWKQLIDMIVDLIENKVLITNTQASSLLSSAPITTNNEVFYNPDGQVKQSGDQFVNQKLADTFKTFIANDKWGFHRGTCRLSARFYDS